MRAVLPCISLIYIIIALFGCVYCIRILPRRVSSFIQTPNELLSEQASISEAAYSSSAELTVESICESALEIYSAFGNDTIVPFDSCNYTDLLLGSSNSAFEESVPECLSNVVDIFCTFEFNYDEAETMSVALFDFVISSISYCVNDVETSTLVTTCPGLNKITQKVTDLEAFCTGLEKMTEVLVGDDTTLVALDVSTDSDVRIIYKYVAEKQKAQCKQIVENYNYCIYIEMLMGSDSVTDCYDHNFEMYNDVYMELLNTNMVNTCSNIVVPTLIYYAGIEDLTLGSTIADFCSTMTDLNVDAIEERIANMSEARTANSKTIAGLRSNLDALDDFADYLSNATSFIDDVVTEFTDFYETITEDSSDSIEVTELEMENIIFLNDTLIQTVAYTQIFKENTTFFEGDIYSNIGIFTADIKLVSQLFNITNELLEYINGALANGTNTTDINSEQTISSTTTVSYDDILKIYEIFTKGAGNAQNAITALNTLVVAEEEEISAEIATINEENIELTTYITNLIAQREINVDLESYLV